MPPRYAYWTILIDGKPTAFRATKQEELQPTLVQLQRTNTSVVMKWFARGKIWENPEQAQWASQNMAGVGEKRGSAWRPGGSHEDPRARFDRKKRDNRGAPKSTGQASSGKPREDHRRASPPPQSSAGSRDLPARPPHAGPPPGRRPPPPVTSASAERPRDNRFERPGARPPDRTYSDMPKGAPARKPFRPRPEQQPFAARSDKPAGQPPPHRSYAPPAGRPSADRPPGKTGHGAGPGSQGDRSESDRSHRKSFGDRPPSKPFNDRPGRRHIPKRTAAAQAVRNPAAGAVVPRTAAERQRQRR
jgi:hypothetical protein